MNVNVGPLDGGVEKHRVLPRKCRNTVMYFEFGRFGDFYCDCGTTKGCLNFQLRYGLEMKRGLIEYTHETIEKWAVNLSTVR